MFSTFFKNGTEWRKASQMLSTTVAMVAVRSGNSRNTKKNIFRKTSYATFAPRQTNT